MPDAAERMVPEAGNILAAGVTTANVIKIRHQAI
jgi:hypothetical protein